MKTAYRWERRSARCFASLVCDEEEESSPECHPAAPPADKTPGAPGDPQAPVLCCCPAGCKKCRYFVSGVAKSRATLAAEPEKPTLAPFNFSDISHNFQGFACQTLPRRLWPAKEASRGKGGSSFLCNSHTDLDKTPAWPPKLTHHFVTPWLKNKVARPWRTRSKQTPPNRQPKTRRRKLNRPKKSRWLPTQKVLSSSTS